MRLERLCWEERGKFYVAMTDVGFFRVPPEPGGWNKRTPWTYSTICRGNFMHPEVLTLLGIPTIGLRPRFAPPRLGGCNCIARRG